MSVQWKRIRFLEYSKSAGGLFGEHHASEEYLVICPTTMTIKDVLDDAGAPKVGTSWEHDSRLKCTQVRAQILRPGVFRVRAEYEIPELKGRAGGLIYIVPVERPPVVRWETHSSPKVIEKDLNNTPVANSAGDRFDPPLEVDWAYPQVTVEVPVLELPVGVWNYLNAVNSSTWEIDGYSVAAGKARIVSMSLSEWQFEDWQGELYPYRIFSYTALLTGETWQPSLLDCGYRERIGGELRQIVLPNGLAPSTPVLLNGQGRAQLEGQPEPVFLQFVAYPELDFNFLPP